MQLHVTVETESMALEDLLLDLCYESTHCTLLVFWQLQAHLTGLSSDPDTYGFFVCKRLYNKLQQVLFDVGERQTEKMRENISPALIMASVLAASPGLPGISGFSRQMIVSQGRKERYHIFHIASKRLRSRSMSDRPAPDQQGVGSSSSSPNLAQRRGETHQSLSKTAALSSNSIYIKKRQDAASLPDVSTRDQDGHGDRPVSPATSSPRSFSHRSSPSSPSLSRRLSSTTGQNSPRVASLQSHAAMVQALKNNYFRCETQFVYALQSISTRLLQVPKQARQSALRAELALLNRDLPAEVDLPLLLPTSTRGPRARQNRIVRIAPGEATVLNSAEKVPFLLLIEYLKNDVDFDPEKKENSDILSKDRRYIFDMAHLHGLHGLPYGVAPDSSEVYLTETGVQEETTPEEIDMGDMAVLNGTTFNSNGYLAQDALKASISSLPNLNVGSLRKDTASPRASDLSFSSSYGVSASQSVDVTDLASQMRTAAIMLTQLDGAGGSKLPRDEVANIKAKIIANMQSMEGHSVFSSVSIFKGEAGERKLENDLKTAGISSDDPSAANLGEDWQARKERIRHSSPYGHLPNWDLFSVIAKTGFDLRQEAFACQLIHAMSRIWQADSVGVWTKDMKILITNESTGLVETITNGLSIHSIKKALTTASIAKGENPKGTIASISDYFSKTFGDRNSPAFQNALSNFTQSLAAYSLICYILQVKDRHNGNILLDNVGHIIHIDFGFLLSNTPGRFGFEAAPFKLTQEYVDLMGGPDSECFHDFRSLLKHAFRAIRKHAESIIMLVEMMSRDSNLPCFSSGAATSLQLRQRFQLHLSNAEADEFVDNVLIQKSIGSIYTRLYDQFQLLTQGIYS